MGVNSMRHLALRFALATAMTGVLSIQTASSASAKTLRAVMSSDLRILDPIMTTAYITRNHGYMIYDTLLSMDSSFSVRPQMADYTISDDNMSYTFKLREGLKWHDGQPVTAEDCIASLKRWAARDAMGQLLYKHVAEVKASDDRTFTLRLSDKYSQVLESIAKPSIVVPFMMPKRLADTPADKPIPEQIGSGPFKFVASESKPGVQAVYVKNTHYVPRAEPQSWAAGGKVVKVDRVEWVAMPDPQTAINALLSGEVDFVEAPPVDLLPIVASEPNIIIEGLNPLGAQVFGRMNFLNPPFNNPKLRRAAMLAFDQRDFMNALAGDPAYFKLCAAMFACGTPLETPVGGEMLTSGGNLAEARELLKEAGYKGEPVVILQTTDVSYLRSSPVVAAEALKKVGFNVDSQAMDWQTVTSRRTSQKPVSEGGWSLFFTTQVIADVMNPLGNTMVSGEGKKGWFGWPDVPELNQLKLDYSRAKTAEDRKQIATKIQKLAYDNVIYIPVGQYYNQSVYSKNLKGVSKGPAAPYFWNIEKD